MMHRNLAKLVGLSAFAIAGGALILPQTAAAAPDYCVNAAWEYADAMTGGPRLTPEWEYYNAAFQDYNNCNTEYACNDIDIPCQNPPL
jgi:hypothetical protein